LTTEHEHWVDAHCALCGNVAGGQGHCRQKQCDGCRTGCPVTLLRALPVRICAPKGSVSPAISVVLVAVGVTCATEFVTPSATATIIKMEVRKNFSIGSNW
jgi:hypothetical protein